MSETPKFLQIFLEHPERSIRERGALGKTRPPWTMRFTISSFLPGVSPEFASRPRGRRRAVLHAHARCKQRLAPGLSGAALIDELRYCHRACQHDSCPSRRRRRGRIRRGNIRARTLMVVHEAVSARELGALSEDLIGETSTGIGERGPAGVPLRRIR